MSPDIPNSAQPQVFPGVHLPLSLLVAVGHASPAFANT
jgi:hypothetical protein